MDKKCIGMVALAVTAGLLLPLRAASAANVLANPGFELPDAALGDAPDAAPGWDSFGDPYTRWVSRQAPPQEGLQCLKLFGPWNQWGGTGMSQTFPAAPGQTWVGSIWSLNYSIDPMQSGNFCVFKIVFLAANGIDPPGGEWLAGVNVYEQRIADSTSPLDTWQLFGLGTAPAPEGTAFAQFLIVEVQANSPPLGGSVFIDDAVFEMQAADPCGLHDPVFDVNDDQLVDTLDWEVFEGCATGPAIPLSSDALQVCKCMDRDSDDDVDMADFAAFQRCIAVSAGTLDPTCDDE